MLNHIVVMGRLTADPELRRTQSGISVTSFRVAVDRDIRSQNGERETDFIDVVAWRNTAEFVTKYFNKGKMAVVEGRLQIRDWTDREGQKRRSAEIVAERVHFGESKRDSASEYGTPPPYGSPVSGYGAGGTSGFGASSGFGGTSGFGSSGGFGTSSGFGASSSGFGTPSTFGGESASQSGTTESAPGFGTPSGPQSDFADLGEEDGDLPF